MKKDRILFLALLLASFALSSCAGSSEEEYHVVSGVPDFSAKRSSNILRIGAWEGPPPANYEGKGNPDFIIEERYQEIAESGINLIYGLHENADQASIKKALQYCEKAGISYLASDNLTSSFYAGSSMHEFTKDYDSSPALKGFFITDEPPAKWFSDLGKMKKAFEKEYPGKEFYLNLYPTYAKADQLGTSTYEEYLDSYLKELQPNFLSFDHYSLKTSGDRPFMTTDVLYNLELAQGKCQEYGIPMYTFVASMNRMDTFRSPKESEISHQVMTELAYGSRSIQYFCYWTPLSYEELGVNAMISASGERTPLYEGVKNVNKTILNLDEAYLDFSYQGTLPIQGSEEEDYPLQYTMLDDPLKEIEGIKEIAASENTLIGVFKNEEGRDGYLISNFSDPAYEKKDEIALTLKGANAALLYRGEKKEEVTLKSSRFTITLNEGEGVFLIPYKK